MSAPKIEDHCTVETFEPARDAERVLPPAYGGGDEPLPLYPELASAAEFPLVALGPLYPAAAALASKASVPAGMAGQAVLAAVALAAQRLADVRLPYGQTRPLSLFFATVAQSGDRKSSADNDALYSINEHVKELEEIYKAELKEFNIEHSAWTAEKKKIESDKSMELADRKEALRQIGEEPLRPLSPMLKTGDFTPDALTKNWANGQPAIGVFTAEGSTVSDGHGMSTPSERRRTAAILSQAWDGAMTPRLRAGDGAVALKGKRLSMHLMIQVKASAAFLGDENLRDQGLLSRVLACAPESLAGTRFYKAATPGELEAMRAYHTRVRRILDTPAALADGRNELEPRILEMNADASLLWQQAFDQIEARLGPSGDLRPIIDLGSKAMEHAARLAGILTIYENPAATEIKLPAMESAVSLLHFYLNEALRLAGIRLTDPKLLAAQTLLEWLKKRGGKAVGFRDMMRGAPNAIRQKKPLEEALAVLVEHGWVSETSRCPRAYSLKTENRLATVATSATLSEKPLKNQRVTLSDSAKNACDTVATPATVPPDMSDSINEVSQSSQSVATENGVLKEGDSSTVSGTYIESVATVATVARQFPDSELTISEDSDMRGRSDTPEPAPAPQPDAAEPDAPEQDVDLFGEPFPEPLATKWSRMAKDLMMAGRMVTKNGRGATLTEDGHALFADMVRGGVSPALAGHQCGISEASAFRVARGIREVGHAR